MAKINARPRASSAWRGSKAALLALALFLGAPLAAHAESFELGDADVLRIQAAIDAGALSAERLMSLYLARIAAYENRGPVIHAILGLDSGALAEARALDRERR
ncbi:MAG: glutamyl-tRNA amidotransferase, partial [Candidatus Accumulibacter sp.]|nr:glutamyl-tRNA amidotransferase [Accumulibacter sp.]